MKKIGKLQDLKEKTIQEEISESSDFTCCLPGGSLGKQRFVSFVLPAYSLPIIITQVPLK